MLIVVSPAKTLDYESELPALKTTQPRLLDDSEVLIERAPAFPGRCQQSDECQ